MTMDFFQKGFKHSREWPQSLGRVVVVAPDREQSAVGHAVTIHDPLRANRIKVVDDIEGFSVTGTPADCVKLAHDQLLEEKPDLVLSGINHGSNAGINLLYSGTVSAATEGSVLGYPSIAVSCTDYNSDADLSGCMAAARLMISQVLKKGLPKGVTLNNKCPIGSI